MTPASTYSWSLYTSKLLKFFNEIITPSKRDDPQIKLEPLPITLKGICSVLTKSIISFKQAKLYGST